MKTEDKKFIESVSKYISDNPLNEQKTDINQKPIDATFDAIKRALKKVYNIDDEKLDKILSDGKKQFEDSLHKDKK